MIWTGTLHVDKELGQQVWSTQPSSYPASGVTLPGNYHLIVNERHALMPHERWYRARGKARMILYALRSNEITQSVRMCEHVPLPLVSEQESLCCLVHSDILGSPSPLFPRKPITQHHFGTKLEEWHKTTSLKFWWLVFSSSILNNLYFIMNYLHLHTYIGDLGLAVC